MSNKRNNQQTTIATNDARNIGLENIFVPPHIKCPLTEEDYKNDKSAWRRGSRPKFGKNGIKAARFDWQSQLRSSRERITQPLQLYPLNKPFEYQLKNKTFERVRSFHHFVRSPPPHRPFAYEDYKRNDNFQEFSNINYSSPSSHVINDDFNDDFNIAFEEEYKSLGRLLQSDDPQKTSNIIIARCLSTDGLCAVKECEKKPFGEAYLLKRCQSSFVVKLLRYYEHYSDVDLAVMEHCVGSVRDICTRKGRPLGTFQVMQLLTDSVRGLMAIHSEDITHFDINEAKILMTSEGCFKICGFSKSQFTDVSYQKTDIFDVGMTAMWALTFDKDAANTTMNLLSIKTAIQSGMKFFISNDEHLNDIIMACLECEAVKRPTSYDLYDIILHSQGIYLVYRLFC